MRGGASRPPPRQAPRAARPAHGQAGGPDGPEGGPGRHLAALTAGLGALAVGALVTLLLLARAADAPDRPGPLLALFPPGWGDAAVLAAVTAAGGLVRSQGLGLVEVADDGPAGAGRSARLRAAGALLVLAPLPFDALALGGCAGVVRTRPPRTLPAQLR